MTSPAAVNAFDAWAVVDPIGVEPVGAHPTLDAALAAAGHFDGGAVTRGMRFLRWATNTDARGRELLRAALAPHGFELPPEGRPWGA